MKTTQGKPENVYLRPVPNLARQWSMWVRSNKILLSAIARQRIGLIQRCGIFLLFFLDSSIEIFKLACTTKKERKMDEQHENILECCLFFTANSLARVISRMGEEEFAAVGMTPSYAFLLTLAISMPGISQKDLAAHLHMAPSTVSRFVDSLAGKGLLRKETEGRNTYIFATEQGLGLKPVIEKAWYGLYERYTRVLGKEQGEKLTELTASASRKLQEG